MKLLSQITSTISVLSREGNTNDLKIKDIVSDSRKDVEGALFIAVKGVNVDGHSFVDDVVARGAAAVVVEELPKKLDPKVAYLKVENSAIALGEISSQWFDNPSSKLKLIGVTGTNGKTTTATLIYEMAHLMGFKAGLLSTVKNYIDYEAVPATHTTPDPIVLNSLLARMVDAGCEYAAMEISSHAAHQHRIAGLTFAGGVFTNLTRDHLDYHKT
ncbi:MAG: UDP-N-acetylmuramoyl-L-alanyl-D-glutamate--2,6-diaminopimelate ligase, partial [Muribaculaceae bacterium]|nr:UDP-N-acetylmuramoyl-L-alanyl-D-glutamate--2,6-diaminopimelate ligase [Muribaculaceae bacterium]